jgi:methylenetetrahydrofolate reductase (NADPH)
MTSLGQLLRQNRLCVSIEIFPPKSADADQGLWENLKPLVRYQPAFISCTYGAGGSTRTRTVELCVEIQKQFGVPATAHFTCVGSTVEDLRDWLAFAHQSGIRNLMALRGDPPRGEATFKAISGGLSYANELVSLIRRQIPEMGIGVAGYPEKHPEAPDADVDLANLKRKVDAGADAVYTQLFFVNDNFHRFRERCEHAGIRVPIVPGIMPITEFARIKRITAMCGAVFPDDLSSRLEGVQNDPDAQFQIGVDYAIRQCQMLVAAGVPGIHFYALNKSPACERILDSLDLAKS